jgi:hypothetical protein
VDVPVQRQACRSSPLVCDCNEVPHLVILGFRQYTHCAPERVQRSAVLFRRTCLLIHQAHLFGTRLSLPLYPGCHDPRFDSRKQERFPGHYGPARSCGGKGGYNVFRRRWYVFSEQAVVAGSCEAEEPVSEMERPESRPSRCLGSTSGPRPCGRHRRHPPCTPHSKRSRSRDAAGDTREALGRLCPNVIWNTTRLLPGMRVPWRLSS